MGDFWKLDTSEAKKQIENYDLVVGLECPLEDIEEKNTNNNVTLKDESEDNKEQTQKKRKGNRRKKKKNPSEEEIEFHSTTKTEKSKDFESKKENDSNVLY